MVDKIAVFAAADSLRANGKLVSLRSVRDSLKEGGPFRDIGPLLEQWRTQRDYEPRLEIAGIPDRLKNQHGNALVALWSAARAAAVEELAGEREKLNCALQACQEIRNEALSEADRLTLRLSNSEAEVSSLSKRLEERDARANRMRAEEFWTRLMREVLELMPVKGSLTVDAIFPRLRDTAWREAANHKQNLTLGVLRKKMVTRATHGKMFEILPDGSFQRLQQPNNHNAHG
ncbi:MAG: DNA-binding protein [Janthinobacterium lividum]